MNLFLFNINAKGINQKIANSILIACLICLTTSGLLVLRLTFMLAKLDKKAKSSKFWSSKCKEKFH